MLTITSCVYCPARSQILNITRLFLLVSPKFLFFSLIHRNKPKSEKTWRICPFLNRRNTMHTFFRMPAPCASKILSPHKRRTERYRHRRGTWCHGGPASGVSTAPTVGGTGPVSQSDRSLHPDWPGSPSGEPIF